ncbi:LOW QUALITY PROTEIN: melanoma-associated antigen 8-like [Rousettus aegyptiacus]|uniref:LOW QUALITY PROTEIN: melanoma-associated antigen 8-like n=1 Tax=Rousettus aegyptiacus TaxID=9407 RepID=UPI00168D7BAC|nr:LOW QUALITY PROTEIN: melanoma-associated antigen 8-like [Rousettus aegyptiacus]
MPFSQMGELFELGEDYQEPRENQGLLQGHVFKSDDEGTLSLSSSVSSTYLVLFPAPEEVYEVVASSYPQNPHSAGPSPAAVEDIPWSQTEDEGSSSQDEEGPSTLEAPKVAESLLKHALHSKVAKLVVFLLLKYHAKEPTTKAEMLSIVIEECQDHFPEILSEASQCLQLLFGIDVKEVDTSNHSYLLVTTLGLTYDGMVSDGPSMPKTGLLVMLLCVILVEGGCASDEDVWAVLNDMEVYDGREHFIYGDPRELITNIWVQEQYVKYRQVPNSFPARYEFLWGPRAHAETSKFKVLEFLLRANCRDVSSSPSLFIEVETDEEEESEEDLQTGVLHAHVQQLLLGMK